MLLLEFKDLWWLLILGASFQWGYILYLDEFFVNVCFVWYYLFPFLDIAIIAETSYQLVKTLGLAEA